MACQTYNKSFLTACLNGDPGLARIYICDWANILSTAFDTTGYVLSGMTCSGNTAQKAWYRVELLQDSSASVDTPNVAVPSGVAISVPSVKFKLAHLDKDNIAAFDQLKHSKNVVIWERVDGTLFCTGLKRGLFFSAGTAGSDETTFEGITVELKGKEPIGQYAIDTDLANSFHSTFVVA